MEQEQIRIDNLLIQEKNAEQSRIQEWQRVWNANIDSLSFSDIADVKSILVKSKLADLKHYVSGYEEIYLSTEKRLHSQIGFVSKAEEQRIAQEKFEKEKKDFEEKQAEVKRKEEEANKILEEAKNPIEEVEVVAEEVVEFPAIDEKESKIDSVDSNRTYPLTTDDAFIQGAEFEPISFDLPKAETWDSIREEFRAKWVDYDSLFEYLKKNYNVPSKKQ